MVTAYLTYRTGKGDQDIKWYDRAIEEIERLDERVKVAENEKIELRVKLAEEESDNYGLKEKIKVLERRVDDLKEQIERLKGELD